MKGKVFILANQIGITNRNAVAALTIKWIMSNANINSIVLGIRSTEKLEKNLGALSDSALSDQELEMLKRIQSTASYKELYN